MPCLAAFGRAGIGRHDQHDVAEIDRLAVVVGQAAVIHHLQQDVEQVGMRLLDLVEQQHAMRVLVDRIGQQAALVVADIARRRADQAAKRCGAPCIRTCRSACSSMPMMLASWRATSVLPTPVGPENRNGRSACPVRAGRRGYSFIAVDSALDRLVLAEHDALQVLLEVFERLLVVLADRFRRDARHRRDDLLDLLGGDRLACGGWAAPASASRRLRRSRRSPCRAACGR